MYYTWRTASVFIRNNIDVATKVKLYREQKMVLDVDALVRRSDGRLQHMRRMYGLYLLRDRNHRACSDRHLAVADLTRRNRPAKEGPVEFAAPEGAKILEKDEK